MTRFLDGPAEGVSLMIRRAPVFLRVVRGTDGKWDALDQLNDVPRSNEAVTVYRKASNDGTIHMRPGGWFPLATYRVVEPQPANESVRSTARWRAWCEAEVERTTATPKENAK